jgi:hypothetical protein
MIEGGPRRPDLRGLFGRHLTRELPCNRAITARFPYTPINDRPKLEWPGGALVAVWVIPNIEFFPLTRGIAGDPGVPAGNPPSVRAWAQRDYGNRVGIWRLMDLLSKHGVRASPTLNSDICDHHPQILRTAIESAARSSRTIRQTACGSTN